jgi:toxin secretion/phage lysis holin
MIGLDIASGWLVAIAKHQLNSTTSFAGMCKKAMILLLTAVGIILEPFANGLPLSTLIATGFIAMEGLSIVENAAALGIWIPAPLLDVLEKMQNHRAGILNQKSGVAAPSAPVAAAESANVERIHPATASKANL